MGPGRALKARGISPEAAFGSVLRDVRKKLKLSQDELAFRSGYHRNFIGALERGEKSASLRTIFNLSATLEVSPAELVRRTESLVQARRKSLI